MLLNTRHVAELIEKGEISEIKEALEKSMSPGSQTFEQALFKLFMDGKITQDEAMANADSATNMLWLINQATAGEITGQSGQSGHEFIFTNKKSIVNQRQVGTDTKIAADGAEERAAAGPDCILIGEIRDKQTMAMALAYAQSGHLCLATLHANNGYHAMNRIISFYPLENRPDLLLDLSAALQAIISQRLVRTKTGARVAASRCSSTPATSRN